MTTTIGGVPWLQAKPFGDNGPTYEQWNLQVLAPLSIEQGYCLCYYPFADMINFDGLGCGFCGRSADDRSRGDRAKQLRTEVTKAAYPHLWRTDDDAT